MNEGIVSTRYLKRAMQAKAEDPRNPRSGSNSFPRLRTGLTSR
jgi:hypothetical protein